MSNVSFDLTAVTYNISGSNGAAQTSLQIPNTHFELSPNIASNTAVISYSVGGQNTTIQFALGAVSVVYNSISNLYSVNVQSAGLHVFVPPNCDYRYQYISSLLFNVLSVNSGGQTYTQNSLYQPNTFTILATIVATGNNTQYPAIVSYGMDNIAPFESYILQTQSTDGNHPADFYMVTANSSNTAQGISHQVFGNTKLVQNTFYSLAVTYDGTHANLYLNGNLEKSGNVTGNLFYFGNNGLAVGSKYNFSNSSFTGNVSNVYIYNYSWTANQVLAYYQAQTSNVTGYAALNIPYPRKLLLAIGGVEAYTNNQVLSAFSQFDAVVLGGGWEQWSASGRVMNSTVANIKSVSTNTAPNGTLVFMYLDCVGAYSPTPNVGSSVTANVNDPTPIMTKEMANNNWWLYNSGSSGTIFASPSYYNLITFAAPNLTSAYAGTNWKGETPYQYCAAYAYNLRLGTNGDARFSSLLTNNKANNADGMFLDNMWREPFVTADWERTGTAQATTDPDGPVSEAFANGEAQFFITLQSIANNANSPLMNFGNFGDYARSVSAANGNMNQIMHGGLLEEYFGLSNSPDTYAPYATLQAQYARAVAICQPPKFVVLHGYFPSDSSVVPQNTEYMWARYIIGSSCMQNGAGAVSRLSQGYSADTLAEVGWYDEWNYNIGYPISGAAGAPQTTANTNGLWMRQFSGGSTKKALWVVNPANNGTQTVTTAMIGGAGVWKFIAGTQDAANNTGAVINTSFTLSERDARLLISAT
jgi:hypothetical protein